MTTTSPIQSQDHPKDHAPTQRWPFGWFWVANKPDRRASLGRSVSKDHPGYLEEKKSALQFIEGRIRDLETQLTAARDTRQTILDEIALLQASRAPIARVPLDILHLVFENWDDDPFTRNRTVSLVCKKWHDTVWNSVTFWNRINFRLTREINNMGQINRFVELCHQKTKESPLDVEMDFSAILPYNMYFGDIIQENLGLLGFLPSRFERARDDAVYRYQDHYNRILPNFMKKIVNRNLMHVHRWRSLYVTLSPYGRDQGFNNDMAHWILHEMGGNMKGLLEITIQGQYGESSQVEIPHGPLPFFPKLRRFTTKKDVSFEHMKVNYATLEHLCLLNLHASRRFICTAQSNFVALISLTLDFWVGSAEFVPRGIVTLPRLVSLTIKGYCQAAMDQIDAPNLVNLHFRRACHDFYEMFRCPTSSLLSRVTSLIIEGCGGSLGPGIPVPLEQFAEHLYKALEQSNSLVTLRVWEYRWGENENVKRIVDDVRKKGFPLRYLKEVILVDDRDILTQNKVSLTVLDLNA